MWLGILTVALVAALAASDTPQARHDRVTGLPNLLSDMPNYMYAGHLPLPDNPAAVPDRRNASLFYWLEVSARTDIPQSRLPLFVVLPGGVGLSAGALVLKALGSVRLADSGLRMRVHADALATVGHVLYLDATVGTGFSVARERPAGAGDGPFDPLVEGALVHSHAGASADVSAALCEFYARFPEFRSLDTYIVGMSSMARVAAHVALQWRGLGASIASSLDAGQGGDGMDERALWPQGNATSNGACSLQALPPLKGFVSGNGVFDGRQGLVDRPRYLRASGLLSDLQERTVEAQVRAIVRDTVGAASNATELSSAAEARRLVLRKLTADIGVLNSQDIRTTAPLWDGSTLMSYMNFPSVQRALHVSPGFAGSWFGVTYAPQDALIGHTRADARPLVELLLTDGCAVLMTGAQFDTVSPPASVLSEALTLRWDGASDFEAARSTAWGYTYENATDSSLVLNGLVRTGGNLTTAVVVGEGHILGRSRSDAVIDMMSRWSGGQPWCGRGVRPPGNRRDNFCDDPVQSDCNLAYCHPRGARRCLSGGECECRSNWGGGDCGAPTFRWVIDEAAGGGGLQRIAEATPGSLLWGTVEQRRTELATGAAADSRGPADAVGRDLVDGMQWLFVHVPALPVHVTVVVRATADVHLYAGTAADREPSLMEDDFAAVNRLELPVFAGENSTGIEDAAWPRVLELPPHAAIVVGAFNSRDDPQPVAIEVYAGGLVRRQADDSHVLWSSVCGAQAADNSHSGSNGRGSSSDTVVVVGIVLCLLGMVSLALAVLVVRRGGGHVGGAIDGLCGDVGALVSRLSGGGQRRGTRTSARRHSKGEQGNYALLSTDGDTDDDGSDREDGKS